MSLATPTSWGIASTPQPPLPNAPKRSRPLRHDPASKHRRALHGLSPPDHRTAPRDRPQALARPRTDLRRAFGGNRIQTKRSEVPNPVGPRASASASAGPTEVRAGPKPSNGHRPQQARIKAQKTLKPPSFLGGFSAERTGLEPAASGVTGRRYNRLNYRSRVALAPRALRRPMM